jgi:hypothetical protein
MEEILDEVVSSEDLKVGDSYLSIRLVTTSALKMLGTQLSILEIELLIYITCCSIFSRIKYCNIV